LFIQNPGTLHLFTQKLKRTIPGSCFAAGCLKNLLPGPAPTFLQWFKLSLIIRPY